jgi:type 1 fimbria pilin
MKRILPIAIVSLALAATTASAHDNGRTLTLTGKVVAPPTLIDLGTPGPSVGDQTIIAMDAFAGTKPVGTSHVTCTTVRAGIARCDSVTTINGSQIVSTGIVTDEEEEKKPFVQAVTGGTGAYRSVHGELTVSEAGPQPATLTFRLN